MDEELRRDIDAFERRREQIEEQDLRVAPEQDLVDLYVLASELSGSADDFRKDVGEIIQDKMQGGTARGDLGTVSEVTRQYWYLRDDQEAVETLREYGIPEEVVMSVDEDKVESQVESIDGVEKEDLFGSSTKTYVQKTNLDEVSREDLVDQCMQIEDDEARNACLVEFS